MQKERDSEHFTYAELEENDVTWPNCAAGWPKSSSGRVAASGRQATEEWLARCEAALEGYAAEVYAREADAH